MNRLLTKDSPSYSKPIPVWRTTFPPYHPHLTTLEILRSILGSPQHKCSSLGGTIPLKELPVAVEIFEPL
jgi:hypothetical protein